MVKISDGIATYTLCNYAYEHMEKEYFRIVTTSHYIVSHI